MRRKSQLCVVSVSVRRKWRVANRPFSTSGSSVTFWPLQYSWQIRRFLLLSFCLISSYKIRAFWSVQYTQQKNTIFLLFFFFLFPGLVHFSKAYSASGGSLGYCVNLGEHSGQDRLPLLSGRNCFQVSGLIPRHSLETFLSCHCVLSVSNNYHNIKKNIYFHTLTSHLGLLHMLLWSGN